MELNVNGLEVVFRTLKAPSKEGLEWNALSEGTVKDMGVSSGTGLWSYVKRARREHGVAHNLS
jgi:hypothetical protein